MMTTKENHELFKQSQEQNSEVYKTLHSSIVGELQKFDNDDIAFDVMHCASNSKKLLHYYSRLADILNRLLDEKYASMMTFIATSTVNNTEESVTCKLIIKLQNQTCEDDYTQNIYPKIENLFNNTNEALEHLSSHYEENAVLPEVSCVPTHNKQEDIKISADGSVITNSLLLQRLIEHEIKSNHLKQHLELEKEQEIALRSYDIIQKDSAEKSDANIEVIASIYAVNDDDMTVRVKYEEKGKQLKCKLLCAQNIYTALREHFYNKNILTLKVSLIRCMKANGDEIDKLHEIESASIHSESLPLEPM